MGSPLLVAAGQAAECPEPYGSIMRTSRKDLDSEHNLSNVMGL